MQKINVKNLVMGNLGDTQTSEIAEDENLEIGENEKLNSLQIKVKFTRLDETVLVQTEGTANVNLFCNRCLEEFNTNLHFKFDREYELDRSKEIEENLYVDKYFNIDLTEPIREEIILAIPMKSICKEGCKGLCPECGKNLNQENCDCRIKK
jgi:uncharacterized protein